jgi:hypothetical protein
MLVVDKKDVARCLVCETTFPLDEVETEDEEEKVAVA